MTESAGQSRHDHLLCILGKTTNNNFLAELNVIPAIKFKRITFGKHSLQAANGSKVNTLGAVSLKLNLSMSRISPGEFTIPDVKTPIIGVDFLALFNLSVNMNICHLIINNANLTVSGNISDSQTTCIRSDLLSDSIKKCP